MKVKSLALSAVAGVIMPVAVLTGPVSAAAVGQIEGGDIYRVRNVTKNTDFTDPASADLCETVQFKVRIHNPGPDTLNNVKVKATLDSSEATSHSSKVTITADNSNPATTTDTAGVNLSKAGTISYVPGSTELLDAHNSKLNNLPDGIIGSGVGVNIGNVGVSTEQKRFVQFQAKTNCPTPPNCANTPKLCPQPPVTPPATPETPAPTKLVNTGPGEVAALFAVAMIAGTLGYRKFLSARLGRQ